MMKRLAQFDDAWLKKFGRIVKIEDQSILMNIRNDLYEVGQRYRRIIESTPCDLMGAPFNKTLTQRADWVQINVLNPLRRLQGALEESNRPMFATWPFEDWFESIPDHGTLRSELEKWSEFATKLHNGLRVEQSWDAGTSHELRYHIVHAALVAVRRHIPDFRPRQGVYHREIDGDEDGFFGRFPEAMRHIYKEITGRDERLVRLIRHAAKDNEYKD